ncbi:MAG: HU family DNA-binding protein [Bacteroidales bacterium]|nr:HU family DNA-binding protein [Bacteroidales bacterium]
MNKAELIQAMAEESGLTKVDAKKALDSFVKCVKESLGKDEKVALVGFGSFSVAKRASRIGRNPQTGAEMTIPAKKVVKFKAGSELAGAVK